MTNQPLAIVSSGMVTGVGLSAPASCAAIRCAIDDFQETRFMDAGGEWIIGSSVPLEQPWRGIAKLSKMLVSVLKECIACDPKLTLEQVPILLCLAEKDRPGRFDDLGNQVFIETQKELAIRFHEKSAIIEQGRIGVAVALNHARKLIYEEGLPQVIIAGVDSLLVGPSLRSFEEGERLMTTVNSNGFIPGEAASAVLVQAPGKSSEPQLFCLGIGYGTEKSTVDAEDIPLRADGLVQAIRSALAEAHCDLGALDFRIADVSGEQYGFKEAALALTRILRQRKEEFDIWHPADCIGEVGAAIGPVMLAVFLAALRKNYSPGKSVIAHLGNDSGKRAAMVLTYQPVDGV